MTLSFWRFVDNDVDLAEGLAVEVFNGRFWVPVAAWTHGFGDDNLWHREVIDLTPLLNPQLRIRFDARMSGSAEEVEVDVVEIQAIP